MSLIIEGPEKKLAKVAKISRAFGLTVSAGEENDSSHVDKVGGKKKSKSKKEEQ